MPKSKVWPNITNYNLNNQAKQTKIRLKILVKIENFGKKKTKNFD